MSFCSNCGSRLKGAERFCGSCGAPAQQTTSQSAPVPSAAASDGFGHGFSETRQILAVLPKVTKPKFGIADNYTMIFTADAVIFAKLSNDVIKDVIRKSQAESKAAGKNWLGKVGDQMKAFYSAHLRYYDMTPETILAEDKANFALSHASVSEVKLKTKVDGSDDEGPGEEYLEVEFTAATGKFKFNCKSDPRETAEVLDRFYGTKIRR
jgi:hypothetical protein